MLMKAVRRSTLRIMAAAVPLADLPREKAEHAFDGREGTRPLRMLLAARVYTQHRLRRAVHAGRADCIRDLRLVRRDYAARDELVALVDGQPSV